MMMENKGTLCAGLREDIGYALKNRRIALVLLLLLCAAQLVRCLFGVDTTDESYYFTQVLRLLQGDRLFIDIWDALETQGIFLVPFYWLYTGIAGHGGILLFGRLLFFLLALSTACMLYCALRRVLPKCFTAFLCIVPVVYAPFGLYSVSYNNLAYTLCILGAALAVNALEYGWLSGRPGFGKWMLFAGGVAHAAMVSSYPTTCIALLPVMGAVLLLIKRTGNTDWGKTLQRSAWYLLGLGVVGASLGGYIVFVAGVPTTIRALEQIAQNPGYRDKGTFLERLGSLWEGGKAQFAEKPLLFILLLCMCLACLWVLWTGRNNSRAGQPHGNHAWARAVLSALLGIWTLYAFLGVGLHPSPMACMDSAGWMLLALLPAAANLSPHTLRSPKVERPLLLLALPGAVIFLCVFITSSNDPMYTRFALLGVTLFTLILQGLAVSEILSGGKRAGLFEKRLIRKTAIAACALPMIAAVGLLMMEYSYIYGERDSIVQLDTVVSRGPAKGLRTSREKAAAIAQVTERLAEAVPQGGSLLVFEKQPYYYGIFPDVRVCAPSTWAVSTYKSGSFTADADWTNQLAYMKERNMEPDTILLFTENGWEPLGDQALYRFIQANYRCLTENDFYKIYSKAGESAELAASLAD